MKRILSLLSAAALLLACQKSAVYSDYIQSFQIKPTENALRFQAEVQSHKDCEPVLEVRQKGEKEWTAMPGLTAMALLPETEYECRLRVNGLYGESQSFETGALPAEVPSYELKVNNGGPSDGYMMFLKENAPGYIVFTDMQGRVVWYERFEGEGIRCAHYDKKQGKIAVLAGHKDEMASTEMHRPRYGQNMYVIDMEGNRLSTIPTTAEHSQYAHHEIKIMPDGNLLTVEAAIEHFDLTSVGDEADADVWGDGYVVLSPEGQRLSSWNCFEALDLPHNMDWLQPKLYRYDLIHGNSVSWDENGDFYLTFHYIAEIWKVNGKTGKVEYRIGPHGDVTLDGPLAEGGFHAVIPLAPDKILVNNNGAKAGDPTHAQIYEVNATTKTARRTMNIACPAEYSSTTGGNVEILPDGKTLLFNSTQAKSTIFTDMEGNALKVITRKNTSYRAFYFETLF